MVNFKIINGKAARERGFYNMPQFQIEGQERDYDEGIWILFPQDAHAHWYAFTDTDKIGYVIANYFSF